MLVEMNLSQLGFCWGILFKEIKFGYVKT